jgi:hypothetical protein
VRTVAGALLLSVGLVAGCGSTNAQPGTAETAATASQQQAKLTDWVLRSSELSGTRLRDPPVIHRNLAGLAGWAGGVFGFTPSARSLSWRGFRAAVTEELRRGTGFDRVDSSAVRFSTATSAQREADVVYSYQRHYLPDPLYDQVDVRELTVPGVPGARGVEISLSSRSDKRALDRVYAMVFTDGPLLMTVLTDSPLAGPEGHFAEEDVVAAVRSLYDRAHAA